MACECSLQVGVVGVLLQVEMVDCDGDAVDISTATTKQIIIADPDGNAVTKTADFATDGTDGILSYSIESGVLDEAGTWQKQGIASAEGFTYKSEPVKFVVKGNLA